MFNSHTTTKTFKSQAITKIVKQLCWAQPTTSAASSCTVCTAKPNSAAALLTQTALKSVPVWLVSPFLSVPAPSVLNTSRTKTVISTMQTAISGHCPTPTRCPSVPPCTQPTSALVTMVIRAWASVAVTTQLQQMAKTSAQLYSVSTTSSNFSQAQPA